MQPQDAGTGFDWGHALSAIGGGLITAGGALIGWIYKAGGKDLTLKADFHQSLEEAESRVETKIEAVDQRVETKLEELIKHFTDTFAALREQSNLHRLEIEKDFLRKNEFGRWREEDREDKRRIFEKLDNLLSKK